MACLVKSKSRYPSQASARIPSGSPELEVLRIAGQCIFWNPSVHINIHVLSHLKNDLNRAAHNSLSFQMLQTKLSLNSHLASFETEAHC